MNHSIKRCGASQGRLTSYIVGFIFSIILTIIPFWIVIYRNMSYSNTIYIIVVCAVMQMLVHLIYFLHLDVRSEGGWNMIAIVFSIIIVTILIVGSLWIMHHLNYNMMIH
ncbi:cytochrome o ubiquinol oxidase subunit IV [Candidatus Pantoea carbekii]|uniref:Cytochrome bo(3) ubiquinol oxidase subunit 4 n=1 Tax=Candidatus Pantoea carbekii TaxID=1235990 RepID=U3U3L7_9GAMM|nr:cytochrome o ubiquinol oxidase subunit IV [Candidatus Pantoea carbekii]AKC32230.1 cytochrome o ubiquinol oxidase protein CyoD [Candidatus Pantoea carbekii]BAO00766.1 hypothetical protein HHS_07960 [Candidatus Pantoea carbekii]